MTGTAQKLAFGLGVAQLALAAVWIAALAAMAVRISTRDGTSAIAILSAVQVGFLLVFGPPVLAAWVGVHAIRASRRLPAPGATGGAAGAPRLFDLAVAMILVAAAMFLSLNAIGGVGRAIMQNLHLETPNDRIAEVLVVNMLLIAAFTALAGLWIAVRGFLPRPADPPDRTLGNVLSGLLFVAGLLWASLTGVCAFNPGIGVELWLVGVILMGPGLAAVAAGLALWNRRP